MRIRLRTKTTGKNDYTFPAVELCFSETELGQKAQVGITAVEAIKVGRAGLDLQKLIRDVMEKK